VYAQKDNEVYVNLFMNSNTTLTIHNKPVTIIQQNNYPWDGGLKFTVSPKSSDDFNLLIRVPGWAQNTAIASDLYTFTNTPASKTEIKINGQPVEYTIEKGYAVLKRNWKKNDMVELNFPMEVREIIANEKVKDDVGKVALQRGPIVYCAEWIDNGGKTSNIIILSGARFSMEHKTDLFNGVTVLKSMVPVIEIGKDGNSISTVTKPFTAIPYYAWANRGKGEMEVWFPRQIKDVDIITKEAAEVIEKK
jgi:hypothetical protein